MRSVWSYCESMLEPTFIRWEDEEVGVLQIGDDSRVLSRRPRLDFLSSQLVIHVIGNTCCTCDCNDSFCHCSSSKSGGGKNEPLIY